MQASEQNTEPIDAVITWVNGNDPVWQEKINKHREKKIDFKDQNQSVQYNAIGEIDIALRGIIKYAPFVRNIFLVTDNQKPEAFETIAKEAKNNGIHLQLVDHTVIFRDYEDVLPCFNSCSIGNVLYRIPELAEHFIIFNDDTFIMDHTKPSHFFKDGYPIIRGKWERFNEDRIARKLYKRFQAFLGKKQSKTRTSFKRFQQQSAKLAGTDRYVRRFHTPVCVRKSTLEKFFSENKILYNNIKHRFRNKNQFIISSLSEHLEIKNGTYHYQRDTQLTYFRSYKSPSSVKRKLKKFEKDSSKVFMTFQSLEKAEPQLLNHILSWIAQRLKS